MCIRDRLRTPRANRRWPMLRVISTWRTNCATSDVLRALLSASSACAASVFICVKPARDERHSGDTWTSSVAEASTARHTTPQQLTYLLAKLVGSTSVFFPHLLHKKLIDWVKVLHPSRHKIAHFGDVLPNQSLGLVLNKLALYMTEGRLLLTANFGGAVKNLTHVTWHIN